VKGWGGGGGREKLERHFFFLPQSFQRQMRWRETTSPPTPGTPSGVPFPTPLFRFLRTTYTKRRIESYNCAAGSSGGVSNCTPGFCFLLAACVGLTPALPVGMFLFLFSVFSPILAVALQMSYHARDSNCDRAPLCICVPQHRKCNNMVHHLAYFLSSAFSFLSTWNLWTVMSLVLLLAVLPSCSQFSDSCTSCAGKDNCAWCASTNTCLTVSEIFSSNCRGTVFDLPCPDSFVGGRRRGVGGWVGDSATVTASFLVRARQRIHVRWHHAHTSV
jgi:hypothetical protein